MAQRRFEAVALEHDGEVLYPCLGVYVIDGQAAGIYGRVARRPLIDARSRDVAVLTRPGCEEESRRAREDRALADPSGQSRMPQAALLLRPSVRT